MGFRGFLDRWLFRVPVLEAAPIVLTQRRVFVLPTRAGLAFGVALLLMLVASINYTLSLGHLLTFFLGSLGLVTLLHTFRNLAGLTILPGRTEPVCVGETAHFGLHLGNDRRQDRYALSASLAGGATQAADIPPEGEALLHLPLPAPRRGWLRPGRVTLSTTWPLGLIRAWSYVVPDLACLVHPRPEADAPPLPWQGEGQGTGQSVAAAGQEDFAGLRNYRTTDSPKHVAWKALAGGGVLLTKQFEGEGSAALQLDWSALPANLDTEARLSRLTAWLLEARRLGLRCGLSLPGFTRPAAADEAHFQECLKALALYGED